MGESTAIRTGASGTNTNLNGASETIVNLAVSSSSASSSSCASSTTGGDVASVAVDGNHKSKKKKKKKQSAPGDCGVDSEDMNSKPGGGTGAGAGDWLLDRHSLVLLIALYAAQGLPMGLAFGAIPFLLKEKGASYGDIAWFSFVGLPYSVKLLIAPIVDSFYHRQFGRRKSWIIPIQLTLSIVTLTFASSIHHWVAQRDVSKLMPIFLTIVALTATQDIAVDGWSLTMLRRQNVAYASTCQSLGLSLGFFATFTIFLSLSNAEFCDLYVRYYLAPLFALFARGQDGISKGPLIDLAGALRAVGAFYFILTVYVAVFKKESNSVGFTVDDGGKKSDTSPKEERLPLSADNNNLHGPNNDNGDDDDDDNNDNDNDDNNTNNHYNDHNNINSNINSNSNIHISNNSNNNMSSRAGKLYRKIASTYADMFFALRLPAVRSLVVCLLIAKVGFSAYDSGMFPLSLSLSLLLLPYPHPLSRVKGKKAKRQRKKLTSDEITMQTTLPSTVTPLKLLELGFSKEKMASMAVLQTPFTLIGTILAGRFVGQYSPVRVYLFGWTSRVLLSLTGPFLVSVLRRWLHGVVTTWFYMLVLSIAVLYSMASECLMFVGAGALFLTVSASSVHVAGSYLTLLNTSSNMGGIWHKALVLWLVDRLTVRENCAIALTSRSATTTATATATTAAGPCPIIYDGYYVICMMLLPVAVMVGLHLFRTLPKLERLPESAWKACR